MENQNNSIKSENAGSDKKNSSKEEAILNSAIKLFSQYGYTGTTTYAIAQDANTTEKTLFKYFGTKQELYNRALYPAILSIIKNKIEKNQEKELGIYGMLKNLFQEKLQLVNENPDLLKLTVHEFLMNSEMRSTFAKIFNTAYWPEMLEQVQLSDENQKKYGTILKGGLTRAMVALLLAYTIDKTYVRPDEAFEDDKEIEFMLALLFNGINGLKKQEE